jgi:hypothetical protein
MNADECVTAPLDPPLHDVAQLDAEPNRGCFAERCHRGKWLAGGSDLGEYGHRVLPFLPQRTELLGGWLRTIGIPEEREGRDPRHVESKPAVEEVWILCVGKALQRDDEFLIATPPAPQIAPKIVLDDDPAIIGGVVFVTHSTSTQSLVPDGRSRIAGFL